MNPLGEEQFFSAFCFLAWSALCFILGYAWGAFDAGSD